MVIVTWNGWRLHPTEKSKEACDFLTGQNFQPFYKVFTPPKTKSDPNELNIDEKILNVNPPKKPSSE
jgi:hypothetical protein